MVVKPPLQSHGHGRPLVRKGKEKVGILVSAMSPRYHPDRTVARRLNNSVHNLRGPVEPDDANELRSSSAGCSRSFIADGQGRS